LGRAAIAPSLRHAPVALDLARRSAREFGADNCPQHAAAIAFRVLFSVFPLAILVVSVSGLVLHTASARERVTKAIVDVVPLSGAGRGQLDDLLRGVTGNGATVTVIGAVALLWSAAGMMASLRTALNVVWDTDLRRPFVRGKLVDLLLVGAAGALIGVSAGLTVAAHIVGSSVAGWSGVAGAAVGALRWGAGYLLPLIIDVVVFAGIYRLVPAVPTRLREVWPGAATAAIGFELVKTAFAVYVADFSRYNAIYGSLGIAITFMLFVYLGALIMLFGGEVAAEYPRSPTDVSGRTQRR
jgi:membrane protein